MMMLMIIIFIVITMLMTLLFFRWRQIAKLVPDDKHDDVFFGTSIAMTSFPSLATALRGHHLSGQRLIGLFHNAAAIH